jgi:16S rRNA G966 N2-methylase RsmD
VDLNRQAFSTINENLKATGLDKGAEVVRSDAFIFLERAKNQKFDYVFIAPPQYKGLWKSALQKLDEHIELISDDAWVIIQIHPIEYEAIGEELQIRNLVEFDQRHYGSTLLVFYRMTDITAESRLDIN